ncbi:MAG: hypothetical protein ACRCVV_03545 [Shewanella sp.]
MKSSFIGQLPASKTVSTSCRSCNRLTEIEGELVCFHKGQIIRLTLIDETAPKFNLLCESWKAGKLQGIR